MGIVRGICVSPAGEQKKTPVAEAVLKEDWGIVGGCPMRETGTGR